MNCRIRKSAGTRRRNTALLAASVLGFSLVGGSSLAVDFTQLPSLFPITTDGIFTDGSEWSDVTPAVRLNGQSFVYTSADPGLGALYLMYDLPSSDEELASGSKAGPVHFHNNGASFDVFFNIGFEPTLEILKDGAPFDPSDPTDPSGEPSIEGAAGFGPSPNSATPHNMFELEVLFDGSDPTLSGHSHGQYSPDPSHWGAALPTDPSQSEPRCVRQTEETVCDANNDPSGGGEPIPVQCPDDGTDPGEAIQFLFGEDVSNACVNVIRGSGGRTQITAIPLPGEVRFIDIDIKPGSFPNSINLGSGGATPVAILGSDTFDVLDVDTSTLTLGTSGVKTVGKVKTVGNKDHQLCSIEDVSGDFDSAFGLEGLPDGFDDLVCHFITVDIVPEAGETDAKISGELMDGTAFEGTDSVNIVPAP